MNAAANRNRTGSHVAAAGLVITTASLGSLLAFSVFLKFLLDEFKWERGPTAAALSLSMITMGMLSPLAGSLADRYGARHLVSLGGALMGVAFLLLSRVQEMWQLYTLYLTLGVSLSGILMPVVGAVRRRFQFRRGLALGVGVSGFSLGTAIVPLSVARIISAVGWRDAYVLLGLSAGVMVLALGQLMGGQTEVGRHNLGSGLSLRQAVATSTFWKVLLAIGLSLAGVHIVVAHLVTFATDLGLTATRGTLLVSLTGLAGFVGMLAMGGLSDRTGSRLPWVLSAIISVLALALFMSLESPAMLYPFVVLYGFAWGGYAVLMRAMVTEFFGLRSVAAVAGGLQLGSNVLAATGPATAGFVFDRTGGYDLAFLLAAALFITGAALMLWARAEPQQHE